MRFPQPHDPDGRPCLPSQHPRSQPPWSTSPTPTRASSTTPTRRTCWPTSPQSPTTSHPRPPPPPGRHPGPGRRRGPGRRAVDRRDRRVGRRCAQPVRAALGARRDAPDHWAVPAEATIRRTLGRLDAHALVAAVGAWLAARDHHDRAAPDHRQRPRQLPMAVDGKTLRGAHPLTVTAARCTCWRRWSMPAARCWPNVRSAARPRRSVAFGRCRPDRTSTARSSRRTRSTPTLTPPELLVTGKQATTCSGSRPTNVQKPATKDP
jgi:hypothetical protein